MKNQVKKKRNKNSNQQKARSKFQYIKAVMKTLFSEICGTNRFKLKVNEKAVLSQK